MDFLTGHFGINAWIALRTGTIWSRSDSQRAQYFRTYSGELRGLLENINDFGMGEVIEDIPPISVGSDQTCFPECH